MAIVEITVSKTITGQVVARANYEIEDDLAGLFAEQFAEMLRDLGRPIKVTEILRPGKSVTIEATYDPAAGRSVRLVKSKESPGE